MTAMVYWAGPHAWVHHVMYWSLVQLLSIHENHNYNYIPNCHLTVNMRYA